MNLVTMRSMTRAAIRDDSAAYISDAEIDQFVNDAEADLSTRLKILQGSKTEATEAIGADDNTIALPTDFSALITLRLGTDDDVEFVSDDVWNSHSDAGGDVGHTLARIFDESIELYPTPDAASTYTLRYWRRGATITTAQDSEMPVAHHRRHVFYAIGMSKYAMGEATEGDRYLALYEQGLPAPSLERERVMPGPLNLIPAPGPFDVEDGFGGPIHF